MVVLEDGGMMTTNPNQYLQPDYLSPLQSSVSLQNFKKNLSLTKQKKVVLLFNSTLTFYFHS